MTAQQSIFPSFDLWPEPYIAVEERHFVGTPTPQMLSCRSRTRQRKRFPNHRNARQTNAPKAPKNRILRTCRKASLRYKAVSYKYFAGTKYASARCIQFPRAMTLRKVKAAGKRMAHCTVSRVISRGEVGSSYGTGTTSTPGLGGGGRGG